MLRIDAPADQVGPRLLPVRPFAARLDHPLGGEPWRTGTSDVSEKRLERAANLLDVRRIIGGLLGVYGAILLVAGIVGSDADKEKAAGVNVNLWVGLALLLACAVFWVWALTRPLSEELDEPGER
jgi:hypothetical protein